LLAARRFVFVDLNLEAIALQSRNAAAALF
jgi:hypothetical protein